MRRLAAALSMLLVVPPLAAAVSEEAIRLRNLGLAQLENEQPAEAAATFTRLSRLVPDDPLPWANLGVAHLRQQQVDDAAAAITRALQLAPRRSDLLAIRAAVLEWRNQGSEALAVARRAADAAPRDVQIQYALYRLAANAEGPAARAAHRQALDRLAELRPDNLVVLLEQGDAALERGDREAATAAWLRVRELLWQAPEVAAPQARQLLERLEAGDLEEARLSARRLTNVLRATPSFREGMRELTTGVLGVPVERFVNEPETTSFGDGLEISFATSEIAPQARSGSSPVVGDFDGDGSQDLAWAEPGHLLVRLGGGALRELDTDLAGTARLAVSDLDGDGLSDLIAWTAERLGLWLGAADGRLREDTKLLSRARAGLAAVAPLDFDIEGDLDLALAGGDGLELLRSNLVDALEPVTEHSLPAAARRFRATSMIASDLDRDGDVDLLAARPGELLRLDNLRQGSFAIRPVGDDLAPDHLTAAIAADLDNDGWPDVALAGRGLRLLHNRGGQLTPWRLPQELTTAAQFSDIVALDADNDGRLDLALSGPGGVTVLLQRDGMRFEFVAVDGLPAAGRLASLDLDADGDLDLVAETEAGLVSAINRGGDRNHWLRVRLVGLTRGNSKNNPQGIGATLEVFEGRAYQFREVTDPITHIGLGRRSRADLLRVVWGNGVPQNRFDVTADQRLVEEQVLKGSCPFLYVWDGDRIAFVTDLLWNTMLGMPLGDGVWAPAAATDELVRVDGARLRDGHYDLRVTGELWEAFYFDRMELWVVDHPADVEVASNLYVRSPGVQAPPEVLGTRELRTPAGAWTATGDNVLEAVRERDDVYAHAFEPSRYQGVAERPWSLILDLGRAPAAPIRLILESWLFPPDASLNLATAQRDDVELLLPRLEAETASGWQPLLSEMGLPAGKTKAMVVDTPPLPPSTRRLRIASSWWIAFDRIRWSTAPADEAPKVVARLQPSTAEFHYRGFSALQRRSPWGPHTFDYADVTTTSPWLPIPGHYTRYGDVRPLLAASDSRTVIVGPGDEIALRFDTSGLPPVPKGWRRTVFLESDGWGKDADRNTLAGQQIEPLPFRGMRAYPYEPEQSYPSALESYRRDWLTRVVPDRPLAPQESGR